MASPEKENADPDSDDAYCMVCAKKMPMGKMGADKWFCSSECADIYDAGEKQ